MPISKDNALVPCNDNRVSDALRIYDISLRRKLLSRLGPERRIYVIRTCDSAKTETPVPICD